jgi:CelD/BcsL family acetyltransferase involved in cellulose biosynthesis
MSVSVSEKRLALPAPGTAVAKILPAQIEAVPDIEVYSEPSRILKPWRNLMVRAPVSAYQTPAFILPWLATRALDAGLDPMFVVRRDSYGEILALFAFGIQTVGPFRIAVFLGSRDANFNLGLFRPDYAPGAKEIWALLGKAAQKTNTKRPDLFMLLNQPLGWNSMPNPLAALPRQWSPSFAYKTSLTIDAESFLKNKLSKETRKKLRRKESRLAEIGPLRHITGQCDDTTRQKIIEAFFEQKIARCKAQKIEANFGSAAMRDFVETASHPADAGVDGHLELHALACGDRIVAVFGGAAHQGHFSGYFNSFEADPEIAKCSPGDLLLIKIVAAKCAEGIISFDLGVGEARYKSMICDEAIPLFDSFIPVTMKGRLAAILFSLNQRIKRRMKQNQKVYVMTRRLRAALARRKARGE